ncbi:helix-turn-helix transcriptional regulator [Gloeocapsopsis dulcis]|uniref:AraC family transcriptional regulator n=1 Tax=Gloeocapsopsis dulcis AAB1 = 1H9 TaxID=1433147 RepID=A0A6N8FWJ5_9CHRO|nr:AraC family transcriptional regulator [Gloeocapsopsis dulcis]MUL37321.1 AraC family transcriptional regulator [Gloeocapsopsis dulcis AAB1 = 1H9]WNN88972.1 AraC family transcriptional regulator [Gloeocapsopsis dulcis]
MTVTISEQSLRELWQEANPTPQHADASDPCDVIWKYPSRLGQGFQRNIEYQEGIEITIEEHQLHDHVIEKVGVHEHSIQCGFLLSGNFNSDDEPVCSGLYWFCGSGLSPGGLCEHSMQQPMLCVNVHIAPELFQSYIAKSTEYIPPELRHLFKQPHQQYFYRYGKITPQMQISIQQILQCPYAGITKRLYLESKVMELLALMVEQEIEIQRGDRCRLVLKLDDVDRIHQAQTILQQRLDNPPSLMELARLVGLNDYTLKRGFRRVFGKTVFGYLHDYRMKQAQQLLNSGSFKVEEVARMVGYRDRSAFSKAFCRKFNISPNDYRQAK